MSIRGSLFDSVFRSQRRSDRQLGVPPPNTAPVHGHADVGSDHRQAPGETGNRAQKVAKQYHDAIRLDDEPDERPFEQDQGKAGKERRGAFGFLLSRKE
jgi:hypothetical protein